MGIKDILGERFGMLSVSKRMENDSGGSAMWLCECDCGKERVVAGTGLRAGRNKSCGCDSPRFGAKNGNIGRTDSSVHGVKTKDIRTRSYVIWIGMIYRCSDKNTGKSRKHYFGKGIRVCDRWRNFYNFLEDMGDPGPTNSIDRIRNDLGYSPDNCRWATDKEQANNTSSNVKIELNGDIRNITEWAEHLGIKTNTLQYRIKRNWPIERALQANPGTIHDKTRSERLRVCEICGKEFLPRKSQIDAGVGRYCSQKCSGISKIKK